MVVSLQSRLMAATPRDSSKAREAFALFDVVVRRKRPLSAASTTTHTSQVPSHLFPSAAAGVAATAPDALAATDGIYDAGTASGGISRSEGAATGPSVAAASSGIAATVIQSSSPRSAAGAFSSSAATLTLPAAPFSSPLASAYAAAVEEGDHWAAEEDEATAGAACGVQGVVVRTYRGIIDGSEDEDPEEMNPKPDEVQVAWQDGTVENIRKDFIQLVDRPFYTGDIVCNRRGDRVGLVIDVQQHADVRMLRHPHREGSSATAGVLDCGEHNAAAGAHPSARDAAAAVSSSFAAAAADFTTAAAARSMPSPPAATSTYPRYAAAGSPCPAAAAATASFGSRVACCPSPAVAAGVCPPPSPLPTCRSGSGSPISAAGERGETTAAAEDVAAVQEAVGKVRMGTEEGEREAQAAEQQSRHWPPPHEWPLNGSNSAAASVVDSAQKDGCYNAETTSRAKAPAAPGVEAAAYSEEAAAAAPGGVGRGAGEAAEAAEMSEDPHAVLEREAGLRAATGTAAALAGGLEAGRNGDLRSITLNSMQQPVKPQKPPLLWSLQTYDAGTVVIRNGWVGCIVSSDMDYLIQLDSGHQFVLEDGMEGVKAQPRQGYLVDVYVMFPSQRVYVTGKWLRNFQQQLEDRYEAEGIGEGAAAAGSHRLCRGVVKSFAVRGVKVSYLVKPGVSWRAAPAEPMATQPTTVVHTELLPVRQLVLRLGEPVYLNVNEASACPGATLTAAGAACTAATGTGPEAADAVRGTAAIGGPAATQTGAAMSNGGIGGRAHAAVVAATSGDVAAVDKGASCDMDEEEEGEKKEHRLEEREQMQQQQQQQREDAAGVKEIQLEQQTPAKTPITCCISSSPPTSEGPWRLPATPVKQQQQQHLLADARLQQQNRRLPTPRQEEPQQQLVGGSKKSEQSQLQQVEQQQSDAVKKHQQLVGEGQQQQQEQPEPMYTLGVVDRLRTMCGVLWEDGEVAAACPSHRLLPASVMRFPLGPPDYCLSLAVFPHMFVCRRDPLPAPEETLHQKDQKENDKQQGAAARWWTRPPSFGGVEISSATKPAEELKAVEIVRTLLRLWRETNVAGEHVDFPGFAFLPLHDSPQEQHQQRQRTAVGEGAPSLEVEGRAVAAAAGTNPGAPEEDSRRRGEAAGRATSAGASAAAAASKEEASQAPATAGEGRAAGAAAAAAGGAAAAVEEEGIAQGRRESTCARRRCSGEQQDDVKSASSSRRREASAALAHTAVCGSTAGETHDTRTAAASEAAEGSDDDESMWEDEEEEEVEEEQAAMATLRHVRAVGKRCCRRVVNRPTSNSSSSRSSSSSPDGRTSNGSSSRSCAFDKYGGSGSNSSSSSNAHDDGYTAAQREFAVGAPGSARDTRRSARLVRGGQQHREQEEPNCNSRTSSFVAAVNSERDTGGDGGDSTAESKAIKAFRILHEICRCLKAAAGESGFNVRFYRRIPALSEAPRRPLSPQQQQLQHHHAEPEPRRQQQQRRRLTGLPEGGAAAASSSYCSSTGGAVSAARRPARGGRGDDRAADADEGGSAEEENWNSAAATAAGGGLQRACERLEAEDASCGYLDASTAARRLIILMNELFGGRFRRDELFQLLELSRIPGPGLSSLGDALTEEAVSSSENFFDGTQLQNLLDCFSILRRSDSLSFTRNSSAAGACLPSSSSSHSSSSSVPVLNGKSRAEVGLVLRVDRQKKLAHVAWIRNVDAFFVRAQTLRKQHHKSQRTAAEAASDPLQHNTRHDQQQQQSSAPVEQPCGASPWESINFKKRHLRASGHSSSQQISQYYAEADELCRTAAFAAQTRMETVPTSQLCPVSRLLFFPGHLAQLNKSVFGGSDPFLPTASSSDEEENDKGEEEKVEEQEAAAAPVAAAAELEEVKRRTKLERQQLQMRQHQQLKRSQQQQSGVDCTTEEDEDSPVFVEVLASCGGVVWARSIDGRVAPFSPLELLPINTRWCDPDSPSFDSSDDEWVYDDSDSDESSSEDGEDDEDRESDSRSASHFRSKPRRRTRRPFVDETSRPRSAVFAYQSSPYVLPNISGQAKGGVLLLTDQWLSKDLTLLRRAQYRGLLRYLG